MCCASQGCTGFMLKKKICMVGAFAVGKTSLVKRYVEGIFDDKYLTTIGVKISKKTLEVDHVDMELILWDIEGEDEFTKVRTSYLKGAAALILVIDGTRRETVDIALGIRDAADAVARQPHKCVAIVNKSDLREEWEVTRDDIKHIQSLGIPVLKTSAKNDNGVEKAFESIGRRTIDQYD